jgi:hypothetical protein
MIRHQFSSIAVLLSLSTSVLGQREPAPPTLELGSVTASPGQTDVTLPLFISVPEGLVSGFGVFLGFDPGVFVPSSFESSRPAELLFFWNQDDFVDAGIVAIAVGYSSDDWSRMVSPANDGLVATVRGCVVAGAPTGSYTVDLLESARPADGGSTIHSVYGVYGEDLSQNYQGTPILRSGTLIVEGTGVSGSDCAPFVPPPPFQPRVEYELRPPEAVVVGESFSVDFFVRSEIPLVGMIAAVGFDGAVLAAESIDFDPRWPTPGNFAIPAIGENGLGFILGFNEEAGGMPAGEHRVAALTFRAVAESATGTTELSFPERLEIMVPLAVLGRPGDGSEPWTFVNVVGRLGAPDPREFWYADAADSGIQVSGRAPVLLAIQAAGRFFRGDADANGRVELSDAIVVLSYLFQGSGPPACLDGADANDSGSVEISDAVFAVRFLFLGGASPHAPGPFEAGPDPTPDALDCSAGI